MGNDHEPLTVWNSNRAKVGSATSRESVEDLTGRIKSIEGDLQGVKGRHSDSTLARVGLARARIERIAARLDEMNVDEIEYALGLESTEEANG